MNKNLEQVFEKYQVYCEPAFTHRRFKHVDMEEVLQKTSIDKSEIGRSYENRAIYQLKWGNGPIKVLLWSQMHGDEATATMALFDLFNFLDSDDFKSFKDVLRQALTLYFVPMLNPDGAERFQRRTAQGIDMNRDALAQVCPESRLLAQLQHDLKPDFSFNLHDQNVRYAAGETPNQAAIAFLATAYNQKREWNENRTKAAQLIVYMNGLLQELIPNRVGRFSDEFEPRAFGDNIQKWGRSLILIESGGNGEDREKMELRKLNFIIILAALEAIAQKSYTAYTIDAYSSIPENTKCLFDLKIRNAKINGASLVDIGINLTENNPNHAKAFQLSSVIEDLGDLSTFWGIREFDAKGMEALPFKKFPELVDKYNVAKANLGGVEFEENAFFVLATNGSPMFVVIDGELIAC